MSNSIKLLGIARKAGFLEIGEESCGAAARAQKARVLLMASDASDNSVRKAENFSKWGNIPNLVIPFTKYELGLEVGRGTPGMLAITDAGLAASFLEKLNAENGGKFEEAAEFLKAKADRIQKRKKEARAHDRNVKLGKRRTRE